MSLPAKGGSYVRKPDGSLERVTWTERAVPSVQTPAPAAKSAAEPPPTGARPKGEK
ncbi:hypothetical protein [Mycobacterium sp. KBS0706]|uniref:hypothetical protein n=1 Tax=Mycobacterium sp. KBS0706 TaxID=2578109 RepID=UPI00163D8C16|nr:hypothetical protein [Mycobacterium sp. KBS0706]